MGKVIESKYSDINRRIFKKLPKKVKPTRKPHSHSVSIKRKRSSLDDCKEPKQKIRKLEENFISTSNLEAHKVQISAEEQSDATCSKVYVIDSPNGPRLELKDNLKVKDLFLHDELTDSCDTYINNDFAFQILDEISLEGLDGITIEAFWKRLSDGLKNPIYINNSIKESIWEFIRSIEDIEFFKLPEPRPELEIYDRLKYLDTENGIIMEPAYKIPQIYPHHALTVGDVKGSCLTFDTRTDVSEEVKTLDLKTLEERYGSSLVMVASQKMRNNALYCESSDPSMDLVNIEYCILERIGRSRRHGEITQGNMSLGAILSMDAKSVFHYVKQLHQYGLLTKQFFFVKSVIIGQNKMGNLIHLKRFHQEIKPTQMIITQQIVNILREKPDCRMEYSELRRMFDGLGQTIKKLFKSNEFRKFVKTELVSYRDLYPNAKESEYMQKSKPVEKFIKCLELIEPYANVTACWLRVGCGQEDSEDENEEEVEEITGEKIYNMECFKEVYYIIQSKGQEGCSLQELIKLIDIDSNTIRTCIKKLASNNIVTIKKIDQGKQRYFMYYARYTKPENVQETPNSQLQQPKHQSSIVARLKEKQKAACQKSNQIANVSAKTFEPFQFEYKVDCPRLTCPYLTGDSELVCDALENWIRTRFVPERINYLINLSTSFPKTDRVFEINKILNEISSDIVPKTFPSNFDPNALYVAKHEINYATKLILLKASFGDFDINANTLNCFTLKRKRESVPVLCDIEKEKNTVNDKFQYMGNNPITVFEEKDEDISVEITASTPPAQFKNDSNYVPTKDLSERMVSRIKMILRTVYEKEVFEEIFNLNKIIIEEEAKEGYDMKMDKKSLKKIVKKLIQEGYIKIFLLTISNSKLTKTQSFVCRPSTSHTNSLIQSACQQLKWKYFVGSHKKSAKTSIPSIQKIEKIASPFKQSDVMNSVLQLKELNKLNRKELVNKPSRQAAKLYSFKPKFVRMRIIHEFLYYLIYGYDRSSEPLKDNEVEKLFESYRIDIGKEDLQKLPNIYCKEISWKMFLPPLPQHSGWKTGWALMCDIILRLPISVLCKVHNIPFDVPELVEVLNHPIKRFYLVKDLPETIRDPVLFKRKYLFDIHDSICRLAWCGLVQFGPQKFKEKDQVFIYLNQRASLYNTTTSDSAYNKITNKEYQKLTFYFNSQEDVDNYWYNTYAISLNTKLNTMQNGQLVTIYDPQSRPELVKALKSKTPEEAIEDDKGEIPGDRRGAAGFDSSLWVHIIKNWFWASQKRNQNDKPSSNMGLRQEKLEKIFTKNYSYNELHRAAQTNKIYVRKHQKESKDTKSSGKKSIHIPLKPNKTTQKIIRRITPRAKVNITRQFNEYIDKMILKKIGLRVKVKWTQKEDRILLLCWAASKLLNPKKQIIPYTVLRDVLHRAYSESKNKTSMACQRRIKNNLARKYKHVENNITNFLQMEPISKYFSPLINNLMERKSNTNCVKYTESQLTTVFVVLMSYFLRHQEEAENILYGTSMDIDHLLEEKLEFTEHNIVPLEEVSQKYKDVKDMDDIRRDVLKAVIHSSLACKNRPGWAFQLFKIYQKYPDNLISEALNELKRAQAISFNKLVTKRTKNRWHAPCQLSNVYIFSQSATFNVTTAIEAYSTLLKLNENMGFFDFTQETIESKKYGQLLGLNEFFSFWKVVEFKFYLPQTMVLLNPHIKDHSELIDELAVRWQTKLKKMIQDYSEADIQPDNESDTRSKPHDMDTTPARDDTSTSEVDTKEDHSNDIDNDQANPLDPAVEEADTETIDRLKTWVTDCIQTEVERRSPSPQFIDVKSDESDGKRMQECYDEIEKVSSTYNLKKLLTKESVPSLDEIKEGMLRYTSTQEIRIIPYITDMSSLLNKDFTETCMDEEKLERLKNHFITQYAVLEDIVLDDCDKVNDYFMVEYIQSAQRNKQVWNNTTSKLVIEKPSNISEVHRLLSEKNGNQDDFNLVNDIINFVFEKKIFGSTGLEIKEKFRRLERNCSLETILKILVDTGIFLRVGICTLTFVHYLHQSPWLVETFRLSNDEQENLQETASKSTNVKENIDKQLEEKTLLSVLVMPWIRVDGTLNEDSFKSWLCNILSHCLDYPKVMFMKLCEKFCYIKPVDIYYLVEILQVLGCLDLYTYEENEYDLFSDFEYIGEREATFLDNFENMYVVPNNVSMLCMGSFFHENYT